MGENPAPPRQRARIFKAVNHLGELDRKIFYQRKMREPSTTPRPVIMATAITIQVATNSGEPTGQYAAKKVVPKPPAISAANAQARAGCAGAPERNANNSTKKRQERQNRIAQHAQNRMMPNPKWALLAGRHAQLFKPDCNHEEQWCERERPAYFFLWACRKRHLQCNNGRTERHVERKTTSKSNRLQRAYGYVHIPRRIIRAKQAVRFNPFADCTDFSAAVAVCADPARPLRQSPVRCARSRW
jgi:hypothetical protein